MAGHGYPERTIENRADEKSGEIDLLPKVQTVRDPWSIGIIGPGLELRHRDEELRRGWDRRPGEGDSEIRKSLLGYKSPGKANLNSGVTATSGKFLRLHVARVTTRPH